MEMVTAVREIFDLPDELQEEPEGAPEAAERPPGEGGTVGRQ